MGNTSNKNKQHGSPLKSFVPPNRNPKSKVLNDMMMRAVRKIEAENFFSEEDDFQPKTIYYYDDLTTLETKRGYDGTQQLYDMNNDQNHLNNINGNDANYHSKRMDSYNSNNMWTNPNFTSNSSTGKPQNLGIYGELKAPRGSGHFHSNKYFISQKKLNSLKGVKNLNSYNTYKSLNPEDRKKFDSKLSDEYGTVTSQSNNRNQVKNLLSPSNIQDDDEVESANIGNNLEKLPQKKKLLINCHLDKKLFSLPDSVQFLIFSYLLTDYPNLIQVSSIWYYKINGLFDDYLVPLDNSFIKSYMNILAFKRSYFSVLPYRVGSKRAIRMDRNIIAEVLPSLVGKF